MKTPRKATKSKAAKPDPAELFEIIDEAIELELPLPVSTNRIWRSRRIGKKVMVYPAPSYQKWKLRADAALQDQLDAIGAILPEPIYGPFNVVLTIDWHKRFKSDLDNRTKSVMDWAKRAGLIEDDRFQNKVVIQWGHAPMGARLRLTPVAPVEEPDAVGIIPVADFASRQRTPIPLHS
ncbi:RusA family crossover junction endodeoxyribonuclease [Methylobacterium indicum]|uniref:Uncharacterized protein n=1 Tax=Methylobacterium indicum TaxID=1775910 RepID=A0A8H8X1I5_9HYPH|nr:RusA family crossover junction endodeoxyribonuclease [Methylobacterium indicum]BCM87837.1 hypothetical protein mvi_62980 [Methylobacterium indicum]